MISKKILALVLAISVIVCALPAFSVAAEEPGWPDAAETLENVTVKYKRGLIIDVTKASAELQRSTSNGMASSQMMRLTGEIVFAGKTVKLNDLAVHGGNFDSKILNVWGSTFAAHDEEFLAEMVAANLPGYEYVDGEISTGAKNETIRNFVRYILHLKNIDYTTLTDSQLENYEIEADSATITVKAMTNEFIAKFPAGSYILPTTVEYLNAGLDSTYAPTAVGSYDMYVPVSPNTGNPPFAQYSVDKTGNYKVWIIKRDQTKDAPNANRDVYIDFGKTALAFTGTEGVPATVSNDIYTLSPDDNGTVLSLTAGKKYTVKINNKTGVYGNAYGLLLVPADKADEAYGSITGATATEKDVIDSFKLQKARGELTYNGLPATKTVNVTVNGTALEVTSDSAQEYFSTAAKYDKNGEYIEDVTLLDVIIAADKAGVELPFVINKGGESSTVTPVCYETTIASGTVWPTHSKNGNGYNHLWEGTEIFCTDSSTPYKMTINAPKAGSNYYMFTHVGSWTDRWMSFKVNGADVYEKEGDTRFFYNKENDKTVVVAQVPVTLKEGANTFEMLANKGFMRCSYVGFVEAESYADACALAATITASKDAFKLYYGISGSVFSNGEFTDYKGPYVVNSKNCLKNLDLALVFEGDVIEVANADKTNCNPISMSGITGYGGVDGNDRLVLHGGYTKDEDYTTKFVTYSFDKYPGGLAAGSLDGCYLNGYITIKTDFAGQAHKPSNTTLSNTTGDDRLVKIYAHDWRVTATAMGAKNDGTDIRGEIGVLLDKEVPGYGANRKLYADLNPDIEGNEDYHAALYIKTGGHDLYDFSNLYLTNTRSKADIEVTSTKMAEGVYTLTSNKTVPVCLVRVVKEGNTIVSSTVESTFIDFMDEDGIDVNVAEGETVYVWKGTALPTGTNMVPLCAPLTR